MKNFRTLIIITILLTGLSSSSIAQISPTDKDKQITAGRNFVDNNNDGKCDNFQSGRQSCNSRNFVDKNNDGICDSRGNRGKNAKGRNFTDKDKDGICDNREKGNRGKGNCYRNGNGKCSGYGFQNRLGNDSK
ncbi:MAG: hypothetical protein ACOYMF_04995 [Bacteroidales bacterium]